MKLRKIAHDFIEARLDDADMKRAEELAELIPPLKNSLTDGVGKVAGMMGQLAVAEVIGGEVFPDERDWDVKAKTGATLEVKTSRTSVVPRLDYKANVSMHNDRQKCDFYAFCRVIEDQRIVYVLGWIGRRKFHAFAGVHRKGDPDGNAGFHYTCDTKSLEVKALRRFQMPKDWLTEYTEAEARYWPARR